MTKTNAEMGMVIPEIGNSPNDHLPLAEVIRENKEPCGMKPRGGWDGGHQRHSH